MALNFSMTEFTNSVQVVNDTYDNEPKVTGSGIYDLIMMTATQHLKVQFKTGKIKGEEYAQAYIAMMQAALQAAVQIWTQKPSEKAKEDLYRRQIKGFSEDYKQKVFKLLLDFYGVVFASGARDVLMGRDLPGFTNKQTLENILYDYVFPEFEKFDWKTGQHPDAENRTRLYATLTKSANPDKLAVANQ